MTSDPSDKKYGKADLMVTVLDVVDADVVCDPGAVGKEPMIRLLAHRALQPFSVFLCSS